jgi:hypothetical protein
VKLEEIELMIAEEFITPNTLVRKSEMDIWALIADD